MTSDDFEKAFDQFISRREYDQAENALFSMVRISFAAGWLAAGGNPPPEHLVIQLVHREPEDYRAKELEGKAITTDIEP